MGSLGSKQSRRKASAPARMHSTPKGRVSSAEPRANTVLELGHHSPYQPRGSLPAPQTACSDDENGDNAENVDRSNWNTNGDANTPSPSSSSAKKKSSRLRGDLGSWKKVKNHKTIAERKRQLRSRTPQSIKAAANMTLRGSVHEVDRVALPDGENLNEWLAFHTLHFFEAALLMHGMLQETCTDDSCPEMNAGTKYKYLWADGKEYKDPVDLPAPKYIELMFKWIDMQVNDPKIFPEDEDVKFPRTFKSMVRKIFSRLFRLYAHIYRNHMKDITAVGALAHLNSCFKHFIQFVKEFKLLQDKEMKPLEKVMSTLQEQDQARKEERELQADDFSCNGVASPEANAAGGDYDEQE